MTARPIILFEDKLGISTGYESIWDTLLIRAKLNHVPVLRRNSFGELGRKVQLLTRVGNRKAPGFNPDPQVQKVLRQWVARELRFHNPGLCLCMDPALLFLMNPDWDQATVDKLRGGVYRLQQIPFIVMFSVSAWHNQKKEKDIARLNQGFTDEGEWEEAHGGDESDSEDIENIWLEPLSIPYGRFVLQADLQKASRIYRREVTNVSGDSRA